MIKFGSKVKDIISGFTGIATARALHMTGCVQYQVEGIQGKKQKENGEMPPAYWIDESKLKVMPGKVIVLTKPKPTEGPQNSPSRR